MSQIVGFFPTAALIFFHSRPPQNEFFYFFSHISAKESKSVFFLPPWTIISIFDEVISLFFLFMIFYYLHVISRIEITYQILFKQFFEFPLFFCRKSVIQARSRFMDPIFSQKSFLNEFYFTLQSYINQFKAPCEQENILRYFYPFPAQILMEKVEKIIFYYSQVYFQIFINFLHLFLQKVMKECYENDEVKKEASMSEQTKQSEVKGKSENKEQEALKNTVIAWTGQEQLLISLFKKISENEKKMKEMSMVMEKCYKNLEKYCGINIQRFSPRIDFKGAKEASDLICIQKLFGIKNYQYQLVSTKKLPSKLYKERNFDLQIKIKDSDDSFIKNRNVLHLCLGICSTEGEWIIQNKSGQQILKGRTEAELYDGIATFTKIYIRDISRYYPSKRINLVVYCKPSVLLYTDNIAYHQHIHSDEVKPLLFQNIQVKSKKKD